MGSSGTHQVSQVSYCKQSSSCVSNVCVLCAGATLRWAPIEAPITVQDACKTQCCSVVQQQCSVAAVDLVPERKAPGNQCSVFLHQYSFPCKTLVNLLTKLVSQLGLQGLRLPKSSIVFIELFQYIQQPAVRCRPQYSLWCQCRIAYQPLFRCSRSFSIVQNIDTNHMLKWWLLESLGSQFSLGLSYPLSYLSGQVNCPLAGQYTSCSGLVPGRTQLYLVVLMLYQVANVWLIQAYFGSLYLSRY